MAVAFHICVDLPKEWYKIFPWVASLIAALVKYMTWSRGILVTNSRGTKWDAILPLLMGIAEFALFAILLTPVTPASHQYVWLNWLFILSLHGALGVALVLNRLLNSC